MTTGTRLKQRAGEMFSSLQFRNYRLLFIGRLTSNMGRTMRVFARGLWVFEATGSPLKMGLVVSALSWPMLFMPLVGGVLADRMDRRRLLLWTEGILVILWTSTSLLITMGLFQWWYFIITAVISGMVQSIGRPGHQAMIANVVDKERLANAVVLDTISHNWPNILGPAVAGALVGSLGVGGLFWLTAAGQFVTFISLILIRWTPQEQKAAREGMGRNVLEALRHIRTEKVITAMFTLGLFSALFAGSFGFLLPIFAIDILHAGRGGLGMLMTASALGGGVGSAMVLVASNAQRNRGRILIAMAVVKTIMLIAFSQSGLFPLSMVVMFGLGASQMIFMTIVTVAMQQLAPDHLRGRIMSLRIVIQGISPIGVLIMGTIAEMRGAADTVLIGGVIYAISALLVFTVVPTLRRYQ